MEKGCSGRKYMGYVLATVSKTPYKDVFEMHERFV